MLLIEVLCFPRLCLQVGVDFRLVGMVVGKGCVKLSQRQVAELPRDFFRNLAHVMPLGYPANHDTSSGDTRPSAANAETASLPVRLS